MSRHSLRRDFLATDPSSGPPSTLICTADDDLLDVMLDWCSAVGVVPDVVRSAGEARRVWRSAGLILLGDDIVADVARDVPARRPGVFVVAGSRSDQPWDLAVAIGAEDILDPGNRARVLESLTAAVDGRGEACVIAVVGGAGGAGASCVASGLALEAGRAGLRVLLLDGDPLGGGLDVLLGIEDADGLRWHDVGGQTGPMTSRVLADALPSTGNVWVLAWGDGADRGREPGGVGNAHGILAAARRGFDLVVCDVARNFDRLAADLIAQSLITVVVVPEDVRSVSAATRVIARVRELSPSVAIVTALRRPGLTREAIAQALGAPVIARLKPDRQLQDALDHGAGPGGSMALRRAVRPLLKMVEPR